MAPGNHNRVAYYPMLRDTQPVFSSHSPVSGTYYGRVEGQDARTLAQLAAHAGAQGAVLLHLAADEARLQTLAGLMAFFAPDLRVITLPGWDCLPYDRVSPSHDVTAARLAGLSTCLELKPGQVLILSTIAAATQRVMPPDIMRSHHLYLKQGGQVDRTQLVQFLERNGYARTDTVRESGEYAMRGGLIDLFPAGSEIPLRLDLFGDDIETIKVFDPISQRTLHDAGAVNLLPATEYALDAAAIERFRSGYRDAFGVPSSDDPLYLAISEGRRTQGAEHWLPLFYESMATIFDYLPNIQLSLDPQAKQAADERFAQIDDYYAARASFVAAATDHKKRNTGAALYHPLPADRLYLTRAMWGGVLKGHPPVQLETFQGTEEQDGQAQRARDFGDIRAQPKNDLFGAVVKHLNDLCATTKGPVVIASYSVGSRDRLQKLLNDAGFSKLTPCADFAACRKLSTGKMEGQVGLIVLSLEHGFTAPDFSVLTEQDILGDRLVRRTQKKRKADHFLTELSSLNQGDLVVHVDHGIGRFEGLETIKAAGTQHDCLKLVYDGGDRLFLPVENMELVSRYGADEGLVALDRLGGAGWQARKAKIKKDLMAMAGELLKIAAERQLKHGESFAVPDGSYQHFVARFPYQETEDQQRAIHDVLEDMVRGTPADRLVCGDVGFGKTEVALRAAYVVAAQGAQVAVVVPTTLLARQHTNNFIKRFEGLGIRIGQLSRMATIKEQKQTKEGLANGSVQIVIGTHAIFAKDVKFAHLGLVIVDEEQRFGVKQKEALKALKADVHVVTLTATPIPRTLQMALTGVRDLSIIASPPVDRLATRTFVMPFDPVIIREAILRERHRGGQTFYVCPRIADMADVERQLHELVPEVRIVAAHGQLSPTDLDERMTAFYDGQFDVLLATNIIESGLDIPTANTMIVHRADMFGLAQLYQIRGRIGRSKTRAYAYLTYDGQIKLNKQAQKRLEVIEMLDTLGSGFQLASHDMDIRGAGNLLGEQQHGHVREVGVELYQQMLEDAVAAARNGAGVAAAQLDAWTPNINLGTSILIPETYVEDLTLRLGLYRRVADLTERAEIDSFAAEMIDRFGPLPPEVVNLLDVIDIKKLCRTAGIDRLDAGPKGALIGFRNDDPPQPRAKLFGWLTDKKGAVKLRPDQRLVVVRDWTDMNARVQGVRNLLSELAGMVGIS
jgi:transcription-repair coupling factor (superfamily II helicase)